MEGITYLSKVTCTKTFCSSELFELPSPFKPLESEFPISCLEKSKIIYTTATRPENKYFHNVYKTTNQIFKLHIGRQGSTRDNLIDCVVLLLVDITLESPSCQACNNHMQIISDGQVNVDTFCLFTMSCSPVTRAHYPVWERTNQQHLLHENPSKDKLLNHK